MKLPQTSVSGSKAREPAARSAHTAENSLHSLRRRFGNHAVSRLLQARLEVSRPGKLQRKGPPEDKKSPDAGQPTEEKEVLKFPYSAGLDPELQARFNRMVVALEKKGISYRDIDDVRPRPRAHILSTGHHIQVKQAVSRDELRALKEGKDRDGNTWYKKEWEQVSTWLGVGEPRPATDEEIMEKATGNALELAKREGSGYLTGDQINCAYEGYEQGDDGRKPNVPAVPVSNHVTGRAIDLSGIDWDKLGGPWSKEARKFVASFGLTRPFSPEAETYCIKEHWHFELGSEAPPDPGWSDAPEKGLNKEVSTVDEKGEIHPGKLTSAATQGVWRVPVQGLSQGLQKGDKGPAFESSEGRAVALIPNTVNPAAADKDNNVAVDVLLHLHGYGVGYRELKPGKQDYAGVLEPGKLRDVALYEMEQQLLSHVKGSNRLVVAVLAQGSETSKFGNLGASSDAYLTEVFAKLVPKYLPKGAMPGRVTVSGHSGGGPTAMAVANQRAKAGKRTDVLLFDAINSGCAEREPVMKDGKQVIENGEPKTRCKRCESNEYGTASRWTTDRINAELSGLAGIPEDQQKAELQKNGTRFRGYTSASLKTTSTCSYGYWYNKLKDHIETTIGKTKVDEAVRDQLRQNYEVREVQGPHERVMAHGNLEAALKD